MTTPRNFVEGDEAVFTGGIYRRPSTDTHYFAGQVMTLTKEEIDRPDVKTHWRHLTDEELEAAEGVYDDGTDDDMPADFNDIDDEQLRVLMEKKNVRQAKQFAANEQWDIEGLKRLSSAEEATKNRKSVLEQIDGRITELESEQETGTPA